MSGHYKEIRIMARIPHHIRKRLASWHLKRVPFPAVPIIDPYNADPIQNGSVFDPDLRQDEIEHIKHDVFGNGYTDTARLWSWLYARRKFGRNIGMGKTALLLYLAKAINKNYGKTFFGWSAHWLCTYVLLPANIKSLDELHALALFSLCQNTHGKSVIELLRARLRRKVLLANLAGSYDKTIEHAQETQFASDQWLQQHGVELSALSEAVVSYLLQQKLEKTFAQAVAQNTFADYLASLNGGNRLQIQRNAPLLQRAKQFFLNDIATIVKLAEIRSLVILIDDFYRLIIRTPPGERRELAAEIRTIIRDGHFVSTGANLYRWLTVIHTSTVAKFNAAWEERDLHQIAKLDYQNDSHGTALKPLPFSAGRQMLQAFLADQRAGKVEDPSFPFTKEGLEALARIASDQVSADPDTCEPRSLLQAAFEVCRAALYREDLHTPLDGAFVEHILQGKPLPKELGMIDTDEDVINYETTPILETPCPCTCHSQPGETIYDMESLVEINTSKGTNNKITIRRCHNCNSPLDSE
jgi:hypothetical protein